MPDPGPTPTPTPLVPTHVGELVARFEQDVENYHAGRLNETELRRFYLDPLFTTLGWDVDNSLRGRHEVRHEDRVRVGGRVTVLFGQADARYNSGLFHFTGEKGRAEAADGWMLGLAIDDRVLKEILRDLYPPASPYDFAVMPADILGSVYERFLGKTIRLTPAHRAVVEEKPEVRKAGGVYYTPTTEVEAIVQRTVGRALAGRKPADIDGSRGAAPLRIADPACGSGSFLIGAYQHLLDWYLDAYVADGPEKRKRQVYAAPEWRLTTATDGLIDGLVYELCALTDAERRIVEEGER